MRRGRTLPILIAAVVAVASLAFVSAAAAQQPHPACAQPGTAAFQVYCPEHVVDDVAGVQFEQEQPLEQVGVLGVLPVTGSELTIFALVGGLLLAGGLVIRAAARGTSRSD